jgi:hypothetical protein
MHTQPLSARATCVRNSVVLAVRCVLPRCFPTNYALCRPRVCESTICTFVRVLSLTPSPNTFRPGYGCIRAHTRVSTGTLAMHPSRGCEATQLGLATAARGLPTGKQLVGACRVSATRQACTAGHGRVQRRSRRRHTARQPAPSTHLATPSRSRRSAAAWSGRSHPLRTAAVRGQQSEGGIFRLTPVYAFVLARMLRGRW